MGRACVFQTLLSFSDLIYLGSTEYSITVMANASVPMRLNADVIFYKGQAKNLGWDLGEIMSLHIIILLFMPRTNSSFWLCIFKQSEC